MIDGEAGSGIVEREQEQAYWLRGFLETPLDLRSRRLWSSVWTFTWGYFATMKVLEYLTLVLKNRAPIF